MTDATQLDMPPDDYTETDLGMSNFDHKVDDGFAEALRAGKVFGRHSGWNFNGLVWWDGAQYREAVHRYGQHSQTFAADTLEDLMRDVNDEWGSE